MMSGKLIKIYVGAGLCSKLAWHTDNPQFIPALTLNPSPKGRGALKYR